MATMNMSHTRAAGFQRSAAGVATHAATSSPRCSSSSAAAAAASHGTCHAPCTPMRSSQLRQPAFTAAQQRSCQRGSLQRRQAAGMDVMPAWTLDQIAGLVFGGIMLLSVTSASQVDVWVAKAQRRNLGLCEQCGGVNNPATCNKANCPMKGKFTGAAAAPAQPKQQ